MKEVQATADDYTATANLRRIGRWEPEACQLSGAAFANHPPIPPSSFAALACVQAAALCPQKPRACSDPQKLSRADVGDHPQSAPSGSTARKGHSNPAARAA